MRFSCTRVFRGGTFKGAARVGLVALSAIAAAVLLAAGVPAAKQWLDTVVFNQRYYAALKASQVASFETLVERYEDDQLRWAPLLPPCEKPLVLSEQIVAADFASGAFSKEALAGLAPSERLGVTVYPVLVIEDPLTRARVVTCGERELARVPAPPDYDPLWALEVLCGDAARAAAWREQSPWLASLFDSSRIVGRYALLPTEDLNRYVTLISATTSRKSLLEAASAQRLAMRTSVEQLTISGLEQASTGMVLTIDYPDGFTNALDIFGTADLIAYWWNLLGTASVSTAATSIVWMDTGATNVASRYYRIGVAGIDSDEDGYADAREDLMYHSDPDDSASFPVTVSGTVTHSNTPQSGPIYVVAVKASNSWDTGRSDSLASPGAFAVEGVPNLADYWIRAWRDWRPNGVPDAWEATGTATNCPIWLSDSVSNLAISLCDPPQSINGTLSYTGRQAGIVYTVAVLTSNSMALAYSDAIPSPGVYSIADLPQTTYWARAWIDADGLTDADEFAWDADPDDADTDADGASDGAEVAAASSPTTASTPDTLTLAVSIGDLSDKPSEKYKITFSNAAETIEWTAMTFGGLWSTNLVFQKGTSYTIRVSHVGTSPITNSSDCWPNPDYDYIAQVESKPNSTNGIHDAWIYGDGFAIHDPDKILGTHDGEDCTPNFAATNGSGKATLYVLRPQFRTYPSSVSGPDKPHDINLATRQNESVFYAPYAKCVSHVWSTAPLDLSQYLNGYDDPDAQAMFHNCLSWRVNGIWQTSYELTLGGAPDADEVTRFNVDVASKTEGDVQDFLIVTTVPASTPSAFAAWHTAEAADMGWLSELPAVYSNLTFGASGSPTDPEPGPCDEWNGPAAINTFYHPDGYFQMRSHITGGDHGHQTVYRSQASGGGLIETGISAGSADREAPWPEQWNPLPHVGADVRPFVWATQLDGNPVQENGTTMTAPVLHEGAYVNAYFEVRPAVANALPALAPGTCP